MARGLAMGMRAFDAEVADARADLELEHALKEQGVVGLIFRDEAGRTFDAPLDNVFDLAAQELHAAYGDDGCEPPVEETP